MAAGCFLCESNMAKRTPKVDYISADLREFAFPIKDLVFDTENERMHSVDQIGVIACSMKEHLQDQLITAEQGTNLIIKGHGRVMAAKSLGWSHIAVLFVPKEDRLKRSSRRLVDNRSAELATWDLSALARTASELKDSGVDMDSIGFKPEDLSPLFELLEASNQPSEESALELTDKPLFPEPIRLTWEQRAVFERAYASLMGELGEGISEGRVIELVCADFMAGRTAGDIPDDAKE
jgi:hypothetical protein